MTETLVLRLPEADGPASWQVVDAFGNRLGQPQQGLLAQAAQAATGRRLRVCVSGSDVMLLHADIPSSNAQKILQAVPFALEDKLAEDVETLHFAVGRRDAQGYPVAIVARTRMRRWLDELSAAGMNAVEMLPDYLAVPTREYTVTVVPDDGCMLVRFPDGTGLCAEAALIPLMIKRHLAALPGSESVTHALVYGSQETLAEDFDKVLSELGLELAFHPLSAGAIAVMASTSRTPPAINLLQGEFGVRGSVIDQWRRWRPTAILAGAMCAVLLVQQGISEFQLRRESAQLSDQITQVFHQALPTVTRMEDPRAQMQQRLNKLNGGGNSGGVLVMLTAVGNALQSKSGLQLQSFNYHNGTLQLEVQAGSMDDLNAMKTTLAGNASLHVDLDSVSSKSGTTIGHLIVSQGDSG